MTSPPGHAPRRCPRRSLGLTTGFCSEETVQASVLNGAWTINRWAHRSGSRRRCDNDFVAVTDTNLGGMTPAELEAFFADLGEPRYRATQAFRRIHHHRARALDEWTELPRAL